LELKKNRGGKKIVSKGGRGGKQDFGGSSQQKSRYGAILKYEQLMSSMIEWERKKEKRAGGRTKGLPL